VNIELSADLALLSFTAVVSQESFLIIFTNELAAEIPLLQDADILQQQSLEKIFKKHYTVM